MSSVFYNLLQKLNIIPVMAESGRPIMSKRRQDISRLILTENAEELKKSGTLTLNFCYNKAKPFGQY